jgi:hypothetical protein
MDKIILALLFLAATAAYADPGPQPKITRGVWGQVTLIKGDCMPTSDTPSKCQRVFVPRTVYVLEPVKGPQMEGTRLKGEGNIVQQAVSNPDGFYEIELPDGTYSIFAEDDDGKYCNAFGGQAEACQVTVKNAPERFDINIDHATW